MANEAQVMLFDVIAESGGCAIEGCDRTGKITRGWCRMHYLRWWKTGDPLLITLRSDSADLPARKCKRCGALKPRSDYYPTQHGNPGTYCKPCSSIRAMEWKDKNYDRALDGHLRRRFGITLDEYNKLLADQGGVCAICGEPPTIANYKFSRRPQRGDVKPRLVVDHDHVTERVRGLLCSLCNAAIGHLGDDPNRVRSALRYLEEGRNGHG